MSDSVWRETLEAIETALSILPADHRSILREVSIDIHRWIEPIDPIMTEYCLQTCPSCESPCCDAGKIFFNRADLIYLTALGAEIPPGQTRSVAGAPCRYLGADGCGLPRGRRPYVCVWFLCEAQMLLFDAGPPAVQRLFIRAFERIRASRLFLESLYDECAGSVDSIAGDGF